MFRRKKEPENAQMIPVLCKLWEEDGVWNGSAIDLPVAAFGQSFEEAKKHLTDAIVCHFEALHELGDLKTTAEYLQRRAKDFNVRMEEIPKNRSFVRMDATWHDNRLAMV